MFTESTIATQVKKTGEWALITINDRIYQGHYDIGIDTMTLEIATQPIIDKISNTLEDFIFDMSNVELGQIFSSKVSDMTGQVDSSESVEPVEVIEHNEEVNQINEEVIDDNNGDVEENEISESNEEYLNSAIEAEGEINPTDDLGIESKDAPIDSPVQINNKQVNEINKGIDMKTFGTVTAVECSVCGALHKMDSKGYFTIYGDVTEGNDILLNETSNISNGMVVNATHICKNPDCFSKFFKMQ